MFWCLQNSPAAGKVVVDASTHAIACASIVIVAVAVVVRVGHVEIANFLAKKAPRVSHSTSEWNNGVAPKTERILCRWRLQLTIVLLK